MKAPFSKEAKELFGNPELLKQVQNQKEKKIPISELEVKTKEGVTYRIHRMKLNQNN